jgi:hypothetical protein
MYFQLVPSTRRTEETEFGLLHTMLPTPLASDAAAGAVIGKNDTFKMTSGLPRKINQNGKDGSVGLARLVQLMPEGLLPTPRANQVNGCDLNSESLANRNKGNLEEHVAKWVTENMLPTPNAAEGEKYCTTYNEKSQMGRSLTPLMNKLTGQSSQLSPQFVMEMMGFPTDWTVLPFLSGEPSQSKQEATQ